jgi:hypothetical protein
VNRASLEVKDPEEAMRIFAFAVLAASAAMVSAQSSAPAPSDAGQLFQWPPTLWGSAPQFKLQIPGFNSLPGYMSHVVVETRSPGPNANIDEGIVMHPPKGTFAQQPSQPAPPQKLYPGLQFLPAEVAGLALPGGPFADAKMEPIPTTWPHAKVELIPRTFEGYKAMPVLGDAKQRK